MNARTPKEVGHLWFENVWDKRESHLISELMAPDGVGHLEGGQDIIGPGDFVKYQQSFLEAMPDIRLKVINSLADGDDVCINWQATGIHSGPAFGLDPSGAAVEFSGVTWLRVKNGQIVEGWDFWNRGGLIQTLAGGAMPDQ